MAPKKSKQLPVTHSENECKTTKSPLNHWAFLDEIEAPMWVDLISEAKSTSHENDDGWFHTSHKFHQCSSRQLISEFSHSGEICVNSICDIQGPSSPKLPSSVSKSRGKHYKTRDWAQNNCVFTTMEHPVKNLSRKLSGLNSEDFKDIRPRLGAERVKICGRLQEESNITETTGPSNSKMNTSVGNSKIYSGASPSKKGENNSVSTITSDSNEQFETRSLEVEVSGQINGQTSKLLSSLRICLRKSCVTRPAARMEIKRVRKSEGSKSSSGKSSVGSSSHPRHDRNNKIGRGILYNDKIPNSRNAKRISKAPENILKGPGVSKASAVQLQHLTSNCGRKTGTVVQKPIDQETSKAKVQNRSVHPKVLLPHGTNEEDRLSASRANGKIRVNEQHNRLLGADKENAFKIMATSKRSMAGGKVSGVVTQVQKPIKENMPAKKDIGKQVLMKKKSSCRSGPVASANMVQKVYLR